MDADGTTYDRSNEAPEAETAPLRAGRRRTRMPIADRPDNVRPGVFEALYHIGVAIGGVLEPVGLARLVAEHARALLVTHAAGLWMFDERSGLLKALHLDGPRPYPDPRPSTGIIGRAFTQRKAVVVLDYATWEHAVLSARQVGDPPAMVAVPLLVGGRAIGVLAVGFPEPRQATPAAVKTLTLLAAQVAPALEAARLHDAAREELAERESNEEALRFQAKLLEAVEHALIALDLDGAISYWNRAAEKIYGWRSDEALGRNAQELLLPGGLSVPGDGIVARVAAGKSWSGEFSLLRRDGTVVPVLVSDSPVRDAAGRVIGLIGASIDISERVEATRRLKESEQRFRSMFEFHPDAVFVLDPTRRVTQANPGCARLSGFSLEEILSGRRVYDPPDKQERSIAFFAAALRGEPQQFESVIAHKDGHHVDIWTTQIPIVVEGQVTGVFGIARDITERRTARAALRASEQRFRAVWEHAADAMVLSDPDGIIQLVNPACGVLYSRETDELIGHDFALILPGTERANAELWHRELFAAPQPPPTFRNRVRRANGEECTVECRAEFVSHDGQRVGLITIIRDITERVRAEQERESLLQALAVAQQNVQQLLAQVLKPDPARSARRADLEARVASLTPRERDVLRQLAAGKTNQGIGQVLGLSPKAARNRVADVLAKLGVADRTAAAVVAVELGLTVPSS
jgi:PAS domain S-box-containing protein